MRHAFPFRLLSLTVLLLAALVTAPSQAAHVGGPCSYQDFPGRITILSVTPVPQPREAGARLPYQPHRVAFVFTPSVPVPHALYSPGRAYELTLSGGELPGPEFLKKFGIRQGAVFRADMHIIASGTCSPLVFTFHGIDVYDRFEFARH